MEARRYTSPMADAAPTLVGMTRDEIQAALGDRPDARLRAKQIAHHIYGRAVDSFDAMNDVPKDLREELANKFRIHPLQVAAHRTSTDGVDKLLVHSGDHQVFECVLLPYK